MEPQFRETHASISFFTRYVGIFGDDFVLFYHRYIVKSKGGLISMPPRSDNNGDYTQGFSLKHTLTSYRTRASRKRQLIIASIISIVAIVALASAWLIRHESLMQNAVIQTPPVIAGDGSATAPIHNSYGIALGSSLTHADSTTINQTLDGMVALGVKWVRVDFDWSAIQPDNSKTFDWSQYDTIVAAAQQRHLYVLGILTYTPSWARSSTCTSGATQCAPANPAQFATFAKAVSARYSSHGMHYWEIWNEPNNPSFWQPKADPAAYTQLLKQTYIALRQQDPNAYIITAGLSPQDTTSTSYSPIDFLTAVYSNGGKNYFDAVGDHPYTFPLSPTSTVDHAWNQMASPTASLRQVMITNGDQAKKIWITEFGAPTGGPGPVSTISNPNLNAHPYVVDEGLQQKIMQDALTLYKSYDWTGPFFWYSYKDAGNTPDTNENFFGLLRYDGSEKPAYDLYKNWISANQ